MARRDSQKSRLYAAEAKFKTGLDPQFKRVDQVEAYLAKIMSTTWWKNRFPDVDRIRVKDGRGTRIARGHTEKRYVSLPMWARNRHVILHEVAHVVTPDEFAPHGREYAQNYYDLLLRFCGPEDADAFLAGCIVHRVKVGRRRPSFKTTKHEPDALILDTGIGKLPIWANEGAAFWGCRVWADDPEGPMYETDEVRYFAGVRDAKRWTKVRARSLNLGEVRIERLYWHLHDGWTVDEDAETFDYYREEAA